MALIIGPEGDFTPAEVAAIIAAGALPYLPESWPEVCSLESYPPGSSSRLDAYGNHVCAAAVRPSP